MRPGEPQRAVREPVTRNEGSPCFNNPQASKRFTPRLWINKNRGVGGQRRGRANKRDETVERDEGEPDASTMTSRREGGVIAASNEAREALDWFQGRAAAAGCAAARARLRPSIIIADDLGLPEKASSGGKGSLHVR